MCDSLLISNVSLWRRVVKSREKLPWELVGCQGVRVFLLKDVIITTSVTTVIFITITIWVFKLSQFNFCFVLYNLSFWVWSQFDLSSFVTIFFKFYHSLSSWVLLQFRFFFSFVAVWFFLVLSILELVFFSFVTVGFFSFVTIWVFKFCCKLSFWVLSQFEFWVLSQFSFFSFVAIWVFEFCHI